MFELMFPDIGRRVQAYEADDKSSFEAVDIAKELHGKGLVVSLAGVDRFEGLVLAGPQEAWRFKHAICSFNGTGPKASAEILELFGFGNRVKILKVISNPHQSRYFYPM